MVEDEQWGRMLSVNPSISSCAKVELTTSSSSGVDGFGALVLLFLFAPDRPLLLMVGSNLLPVQISQRQMYKEQSTYLNSRLGEEIGFGFSKNSQGALVLLRMAEENQRSWRRERRKSLLR